MLKVDTIILMWRLIVPNMLSEPYSYLNLVMLIESEPL